MNSNYTFPDVNAALPVLLRNLIESGDEVGSRAGRTKELMHVGITLRRPVNREILLPDRKASLAAQIAETMWVLGGRADIGWLSHYLPRAGEFSDDGETWRAGYGARLRHWETDNGWDPHSDGEAVDQLAWVFDHLEANPGSRQAVASIWDPAIDTQPGKDIPCNDWLNFSSRKGYLDLHVAVRSNDAIWGWSGINQFEWSALLEIMAGLLGLDVGSLHFSTTSFHIYDRHWAKAERIARERTPGHPSPSPRFDATRLGSRDIDGLDTAIGNWFRIEEAIRGGHMSTGLVNAFPEPMLRSWLRVLQWWWSGDRDYLAPLDGTALAEAARVSVQPPERGEEVAALRKKAHDLAYDFILQGDSDLVRKALGSIGATKVSTLGETDLRPFIEALENPTETYEPSEFLKELCALHLEKEAAYGGSWKKRGEYFSILPNIGRKVDRLGGGVTDDETQADTAGDLFVYLAKYRTWLADQRFYEGKAAPEEGTSSDSAENANEVMRGVEASVDGSKPWGDPNALEAGLKATFEHLLARAEEKNPNRWRNVDAMLRDAYRLARIRWEQSRGEWKGTGPRTDDEYKGADFD